MLLDLAETWPEAVPLCFYKLTDPTAVLMDYQPLKAAIPAFMPVSTTGPCTRARSWVEHVR